MENTNESSTSQSPSSVGENMERLENELENLKFQAQNEAQMKNTNPTVSETPSGGFIRRIGVLLFTLTVVGLLAYFSFKYIKKGISIPFFGPKKITESSPTPNPTSYPNWKNYTDNTLEYSFSFPQDFSGSAYSECGWKGYEVSKGELSTQESTEKAEYINLKTILLRGVSTDAKDQATISSKMSSGGEVSPVSERKIGDRIGYSYQIKGTSMTAEDVYVNLGQDTLRIRVVYAPPEGVAYESIIQPIFESFKFFVTKTEDSSSDSPVVTSLPETGMYDDSVSTDPVSVVEFEDLPDAGFGGLVQ